MPRLLRCCNRSHPLHNRSSFPSSWYRTADNKPLMIIIPLASDKINFPPTPFGEELHGMRVVWHEPERKNFSSSCSHTAVVLVDLLATLALQQLAGRLNIGFLCWRRKCGELLVGPLGAVWSISRSNFMADRLDYIILGKLCCC